MASGLQQKLQEVDEVVDARPADARAALTDIIVGNYPNDAESVKVKEQAIGKLTDLLVKQQDAPGLAALLTELRPLFNAIPKAKTAKIVRTVIDSIAKVPNSTQLQVRHRGRHSRPGSWGGAGTTTSFCGCSVSTGCPGFSSVYDAHPYCYESNTADPGRVHSPLLVAISAVLVCCVPAA